MIVKSTGINISFFISYLFFNLLLHWKKCWVRYNSNYTIRIRGQDCFVWAARASYRFTIHFNIFFTIKLGQLDEQCKCIGNVDCMTWFHRLEAVLGLAHYWDYTNVLRFFYIKFNFISLYLNCFHVVSFWVCNIAYSSNFSLMFSRDHLDYLQCSAFWNSMTFAHVICQNLHLNNNLYGSSHIWISPFIIL